MGGDAPGYTGIHLCFHKLSLFCSLTNSRNACAVQVIPITSAWGMWEDENSIVYFILRLLLILSA